MIDVMVECYQAVKRLITQRLHALLSKCADNPLPIWPKRNRFPTHLLVLSLSICMAVILSHAMTVAATQIPSPVSDDSIAVSVPSEGQEKTALKIEGTVDEVPSSLEFGQQLYIDTCAACHVGIPPEVMPTQTWADLLDDTQHYGVQIAPVVNPTRIIIWQYLEQFSRGRREDERTPYRVRNSRFFGVLHPRVEFTNSDPIRLSGCVTCHPSASEFNYRRLTPEWDDSP